MRPVVLTDFDGAWTDLPGQAEAVDEARLLGLVERSGIGAGELLTCLDRVRDRILSEPSRHGWWSDGRISAFADEDPFLLHNATVSGIGLLADAGDPECIELRAALARSGATDLDALGSELFLRGSHAYLRDRGHTLLPGAKDALRELLEVADVVFCTNFVSDAVMGTLQRHGFEPGVAGSGGPLSVRGRAQKQVLTGPPREATIAGRTVALDRGHYLAALSEERPVLVVGDVLSLDLAVVLAGAAGPASCRLVRTPFTPAWSLEACAALPFATVIDNPAELAAHAATL